jgi:hypothetical protein
LLEKTQICPPEKEGNSLLAGFACERRYEHSIKTAPLALRFLQQEGC